MGTDGRTNGRHVRKQIIPTCRDCGSAEWINKPSSVIIFLLKFCSFCRGVCKFSFFLNFNPRTPKHKPKPSLKSGFYFLWWCPFVRPKNKIRATTDTMHENDDHLLAVAWWVILNSPDLYFFKRILLLVLGKNELRKLGKNIKKVNSLKKATNPVNSPAAEVAEVQTFSYSF